MVEKNDKTKLIHASITNLPITPRKVRLVVNVIRKLNIADALSILSNLPKRSAPIVLQLLNSGVANATNNYGYNFNDLYIKEIYVNEGRKLKRFRPRAKGSTAPLWKRASHLKLVLAVTSNKLEKKKVSVSSSLKSNIQKTAKKE